MNTLKSLRHRWLMESLLAAIFSLSSVHVSADEPKGKAAKLPVSDAATIRATGTIEPEEVVDVGVQVAGKIKSFGVDPRFRGKSIDFDSSVEVGTVLARIDDAPYAAQVEQAQAGCTRAEAELARERAKLELAKVQWQRAELNYKAGLKPDLSSDPDVAKANVKIGEASVAAAEVGLAQAKAALKQAKITLDYTIIKSPVAGVIIARRVNLGQIVGANPNAPSLFLIAKGMKNMQVWASVNEADIGRIHEGMKVRFTVDAFPKDVFQGTVAQIRLNATLTQNVVTYTVVIDFKNPDLKLKPYLTATVEFQL